MGKKIEDLKDILIGVGQNVKNISKNMGYLIKKAMDSSQGTSGVRKEENGSEKVVISTLHPHA